MDLISGSRKQHLALDDGFRTTANNDDIDKCVSVVSAATTTTRMMISIVNNVVLVASN